MTQLQIRLPSNRVHLFAQNLGGTIASEALSLGASADTFILSHVSMSAGCFSPAMSGSYVGETRRVSENGRKLSLGRISWLKYAAKDE